MTEPKCKCGDVVKTRQYGGAETKGVIVEAHYNGGFTIAFRGKNGLWIFGNSVENEILGPWVEPRTPIVWEGEAIAKVLLDEPKDEFTSLVFSTRAIHFENGMHGKRFKIQANEVIE